MPKTRQAVEQAAQLKIYTPQLDKIEARLLEWTEQERYQALVIKAMRHGVPIFEGCYGTSTHEYGVQMDTIFPVASNTKPIIAALLFILLEDGRLELNDPIKKFIPEYDGGGKENIRIWHFLTHTSGIIDDQFYKTVDEYVKQELKIEHPGEDAEEKDWDEYNNKIKKALELPEDTDSRKVWNIISYKGGKVQHEPRKVMSYCNHGYQVLKEVVCAASGESIDNYAQRVLFGPLGMCDTHWVLPEHKWGRTLGRNEKCTGYGWINSEGNYTSESGSGGLKTTANDMARFCEMILGGGKYNDKRVLSPAGVREMTDNYNNYLPGESDSWSLGWNYRGRKVDNEGVLRSPRAIEHGGWAGHRIMVDPERKISVILYFGEYDPAQNIKAAGMYDEFGRINNMIIAACE